MKGSYRRHYLMLFARSKQTGPWQEVEESLYARPLPMMKRRFDHGSYAITIVRVRNDFDLPMVLKRCDLRSLRLPTPKEIYCAVDIIAAVRELSRSGVSISLPSVKHPNRCSALAAVPL